MLYENIKDEFITPARLIGNLYFVGIHHASTHIIDTGDGLILIDPGYEETFHIVLNNIWKVGLNPEDIKYIVLTHGHLDHTGAANKMLEITDAKKGEIQMGNAPVWYPHDLSDWRGRGVKDINPAFYENQYKKNPNNKTRAEKFGSIVLGEPLLDRNDEPGQPSWKLREEIERMRDDYDSGHILPTLFNGINEDIADVMIDRLEGLGVEFVPPEQAKGNQNALSNLLAERDKR